MGLVIVIEPHGTYAIYEQIVNQIKNQIISGELQPDEALPSIRGLAADIGVSVITTKHAYEELEREGLIRSVSNKGFYVCKYNTDYLHEKQLMELEKRLQEWITLAKQAGLGTEDIREMLEGLLEDGRYYFFCEAGTGEESVIRQRQVRFAKCGF